MKVLLVYCWRRLWVCAGISHTHGVTSLTFVRMEYVLTDIRQMIVICVRLASLLGIYFELFV